MPLKEELLEEQATLLLAIKAETFVRVPLKKSAFSTRVGEKPEYSLSSAVTLFLTPSMHRDIPAHPLPVSLLVL